MHSSRMTQEASGPGDVRRSYFRTTPSPLNHFSANSTPVDPNKTRLRPAPAVDIPGRLLYLR
jgi:hypothetical protein